MRQSLPPPLPAPSGLMHLPIAVESTGHILVANASFLISHIERVDPTTGTRVLLSDDTRGDGPLFRMGPWGLAVEADGGVVAVDQFLRAVLHVAPIDGDR